MLHFPISRQYHPMSLTPTCIAMKVTISSVIITVVTAAA